jgi:hypothetical protein
MFSRENCDVFLCQRYKYTVFWHVKVDKSYVQKSPIALTESPNKKIHPVLSPHYNLVLQSIQIELLEINIRRIL